MADPRICIVLSNQDSDATAACLDALFRMTYTKFVVYIVNGDPKATPRFRAQFPQVVIHQAAPGLRSAASTNLGIEWALSKPFRWICLLPCRAKVDPDFLKTFARQIQEVPNVHIFGAWDQDPANSERMQQVDCLNSTALVIHRSVPETIGFLEPRYHLCWEDLDYCFRARRKGFIVQAVPEAKVGIPSESPNPAFWWLGRLLWIERNLTLPEQREVYRRVIHPQIRKVVCKNLFLGFRRSLARQELKGILEAVCGFRFRRF